MHRKLDGGSASGDTSHQGFDQRGRTAEQLRGTGGILHQSHQTKSKLGVYGEVYTDGYTSYGQNAKTP